MFKDKTCTGIFLTLLIYYFQGLRKVRHNKLYEICKDLEKLPKSTFNLHLNQHLVKDKWVIRRVEDVQKVYFQINMKKVKLLKSHRKKIETLMEIMEVKKKEFYEQPIGEQVLDTLLYNLIQELFRLECLILYRTNRNFENKFMFMLTDSRLFRFLEEFIVVKAVKDEEYRKNVLETIEGLTKKISRILMENVDTNEFAHLLNI